MRNIKEILESRLGPITNAEMLYAVTKIESAGFIPRVDSPPVIFDRLSTYIDEFRRHELWKLNS